MTVVGMFSELCRGRGATFHVMGSRGWQRAPWLPLAVASLSLTAGCGSKSSTVTSALFTDADFSVCSGTPAVRFVSGMSVLSASGAYRAAIESASTDQGSGAPVPTAAIGYDTFTVAVTSVTAGGAGADAGAPAPDGVMMTTPPVSQTYPADPYMPAHGHGASTIPTITAQGGGLYSVAAADFFMGGYWQLYLELTPPGGSADPVTFDVCIPDD
jgi:hypothetical protein